jgi:hypothetical protein
MAYNKIYKAASNALSATSALRQHRMGGDMTDAKRNSSEPSKGASGSSGKGVGIDSSASTAMSGSFPGANVHRGKAKSFC